ncbi:hypothetical protein [uncultured Ruegeria sp.]|uniref:hypothetical protein n=1 Tax=uncultured Ruegeria sp. TaxID=259304 RepID=UPI00260AF67D|nr:hypothetical protein [uncultured Ruegeria sp.]
MDDETLKNDGLGWICRLLNSWKVTLVATGRNGSKRWLANRRLSHPDFAEGKLRNQLSNRLLHLMMLDLPVTLPLKKGAMSAVALAGIITRAETYVAIIAMAKAY